MLDAKETLAEFRRRVLAEWLPNYCLREDGGYRVEGFRPESIDNLAASDALDFMHALDVGVVKESHDGVFRAARNQTKERIFTSSRREPAPRPITLWLEPVITVAWLGRFHLNHGWPMEQLGMQSADWAFDLVAYRTPTSRGEHIAGEVNKTIREVEKLIFEMLAISERPVERVPATKRTANSHKKCLGLLARRAPIFVALGPDHVQHVFEVTYLGEREFRMHPSSASILGYPSKTIAQVST